MKAIFYINNLFLKGLQKFPAELSHNIVIKTLKYGLIPNNKILHKNCNAKINNIPL